MRAPNSTGGGHGARAAKRAAARAAAPPPDPVPPSRARARDGFPPRKLARVADLVPYEDNPRTHSPAQIAKIAASIAEFGFTNPVLTDGRNGIIAGHGRVLAAQQLGMETVPVLSLSHLTPDQRLAYVIADNRLALDADWDKDRLFLVLGTLRDSGFNLKLTGFDAPELGSLLGESEEAEPAPKPRAKKAVVCPGCGQTFAP